MAVIVQLRRGTAAQWTAANTLLAEGEEGLELDTGKRKIGDGSTDWNTLPYSGALAQSLDPTPEKDGQIWVKHQPYISLSGEIAINNGYGNLLLNITTSRVSDYAYFGNTYGYSGIMMFDVNGSTPAITIYPDAGGMHLRGPFGTTWQQAIDAVNIWAVANLDIGVAPIISLSSPGDAVVELTEVVQTVWMYGSLGGNPRSEIKYNKDGQTITIPTGSGIPTYTSSDPFPVLPIWFRYDPAVPATAASGSGAVYGEMMTYFMFDFESLLPTDVNLLLPNGPYGQITTTYDPYYTAPGVADVIVSWSGLVIKHNGTSWQTVIDALDTWSTVNLSLGHYHSFTLSPGFDSSTLLDPLQDSNYMSLSSNGQQEQFVLKAQTPTGAVKQTTFF